MKAGRNSGIARRGRRRIGRVARLARVASITSATSLAALAFDVAEVRAQGSGGGKATANVTELDTIEVRSILPERLDSVPGSYSVVSERDLVERRPFSIEEALNNQPGIHVVGENTFGLGVNIGVRGLDPRRTSRTLLLEDGMPLFLAPYGDPAAHYTTPLERTERIEVVKGSGQILYGPQTVGGMINFVTRPVPKEGLKGGAAIRVGNNGYTGLHADIGGGSERGGWRVDALRHAGDGIRRNHDFEIQEYAVKGQLNLTSRHTLIAKASYFKEDSHVSETGLGAVEYAEDPFQAPTGRLDRFEHERKSFQLQHLFEVNDRIALTTQAYYVDSSRASFRQINDPGSLDGRSVMDRCTGLGVATEANSVLCGGRWRPRDFTYWGIEPRVEIRHDLFGVRSQAVIGFRYHKEDINRNQFRGADPRFQDLGYAESFRGVNGGTGHREEIDIGVTAQSYYAQNTFFAGDWTVTPGLRFEDMTIRTDVKRAEGQPQNNPESFLRNNQTKLLPGLGVTWNGLAHTTVFAGIHKGFAPPRPDRDVTADDADTAVVSRTRPEESTNLELGVRSTHVPGLGFEATLFNTDFDEIVIQESAGRFVNAGKSRMSGLELAARLDLGTLLKTPHNVYLLASLTNLFTAEFRNETDETTKGNRLPYAPRTMASLSLGYQHPLGVDARIGVDHVSRQYVDRDNTVEQSIDGQEGTIPSYTLLNATVNYRPAGSRLSYFLSGFNLADREYLASRVDGMVAGRKRQVFVGLRYDFQ